MQESRAIKQDKFYIKNQCIQIIKKMILRIIPIYAKFYAVLHFLLHTAIVREKKKKEKLFRFHEATHVFEK